MVMDSEVVVLGSGISGLSTAYFLEKAGCKTIVLDTSDPIHQKKFPITIPVCLLFAQNQMKKDYLILQPLCHLPMLIIIILITLN